MARASQKTWLPLDRWAEIMGIDPLFFNQLRSLTLQTQNCGQPWFQFAWQDSTRIGREDLARAIRQAENIISGFVGYALIPDWFGPETKPTVRPARPDVFSTGYNIRSTKKSVTTEKYYVLLGGIRAKTLVGASQAIVRTDSDGDGYKETCTVVVATTVTDACEIHVFYPGENGADQWEIRPIRVSIAAGIATIVFNSWQVVDPDKQSGIVVAEIDADVDANYVSTVDVYRIYNDPSKQAQLIWENSDCDVCGGSGCISCLLATQDGCLNVREDRLGIVTYGPAVWNAATGQFDAQEYAIARDPERITLWYYAGWQDMSLDCPKIQMDPYWEMAVAFYAASLLDRDTCGCDNIVTFVQYWREEMAKTDDTRSFAISPSQTDNVFGTTRGALYARARCLEDGRRVAR